MADGGSLRLSGAHDVVSQFRDSPLLATGQLTVVGLDAIAERLGPRWPMRRDVVHEYAHRALHKAAGGGHALVQRISDTEFIVAQSEVSRTTGQLRCLSGLREILGFFLGEARPVDLKLHEVTKITDEGVFGVRLLPEWVETEAAAERANPATPAPHPASLDRWTPFVTTTGRRVGVSCALEPLFSLRNSARIGYRIAPRVHQLPSLAALTRQEFDRLAPADVARIDFASIARGLDRIRETGPAGVPPAVVLPLAHATLQNRAGRATAIGLLRDARAMVRHGVIVEITGIERAPLAALCETIGALRPISLRVIGRLTSPEIVDAYCLASAGLAGVSTRCPRILGDAQFLGWMRTLKRLTGPISRNLFVYQLDGMPLARLASTCGATHATLAPQRLKTLLIDDEPA
jgi:hypothetical protein